MMNVEPYGYPENAPYPPYPGKPPKPENTPGLT